MSDKRELKLCVGMPIQDSLPGEVVGHHFATIIEAKMICEGRANGSKLYTMTPLDVAPHDAVRHLIVEKALKEGCTHLFFMDDDTITPVGGLTKLFSTMEEHNAVVVSGMYLRRGFPYTPVWSYDVSGDRPEPTDGEEVEEEFHPVDAECGVHVIHSSGLGCALIDLEWVSKHIEQPWFRMMQNKYHTTITDDVVFFQKVRRAKGLILGDADVQCTHVGRREFITRGAATALRNVFQAHEKHGKTAGKVVDTTLDQPLASSPKLPERTPERGVLDLGVGGIRGESERES